MCEHAISWSSSWLPRLNIVYRFAFGEFVPMVHGQGHQSLLQARRPAYFDTIDFGGIAQTKMDTRRGLTGEAISAVDIAQIRSAVSCQPHLGADGRCIRLGSLQQKANPVCSRGCDVAIEVW